MHDASSVVLGLVFVDGGGELDPPWVGAQKDPDVQGSNVADLEIVMESGRGVFHTLRACQMLNLMASLLSVFTTLVWMQRHLWLQDSLQMHTQRRHRVREQTSSKFSWNMVRRDSHQDSQVISAGQCKNKKNDAERLLPIWQMLRGTASIQDEVVC